LLVSGLLDFLPATLGLFVSLWRRDMIQNLAFVALYFVMVIWNLLKAERAEALSAYMSYNGVD
jgi:hypothetical protein